ncbi:hypothetical protein [Bacillus sp. NEB1478]|nr:hypothetical protein [Bacillus sp. NEB1478]WNB90862.1 hypothetical protein RGB74_13180 [Bacillus sp. NEB1478]
MKLVIVLLFICVYLLIGPPATALSVAAKEQNPLSIHLPPLCTAIGETHS